jgi:RND family efflux transporter MFP subunit
MNMRLTFSLVAVALLPLGAQAEPMGCLIQPFQEAEVGSQVVGVLDRVMVERGDLVKRGQPLAMLNSEVERASMVAARLRAEATAELQAAASNHDFAQKKKVRTQDLYRQNFVSQQVRDQAATEADVAEMRLKQAREQMRQAHQELALAQAQVAQRTIRSPLSGVVVERYLHEGERIEDKPVLKVATVDPLRVEVIVPAAQFNRIKQGMTASVKPEMADVELRSAKVVIVDRAIDAASNSFRVRLELPNPGNDLPAGLRCKVEFDDLNAPTQDAALKQPGRATGEGGQGVRPVGNNAAPAKAEQQKQSVAVAPQK